MKTRKISLTMLAAAGIALSIATACSKDASELTTNATDAAIEAKLAGIGGFGGGHGPHGHLALPLFDECDADGKLTERMDVVISGDSYPKTITLTPKADGEGKCEDCTAEIVITLSASMKEMGAVQTIKSSFTGGRGIHSGTVTITNTGDKSNGKATFSIEGTEEGEGKHGSMSATISGTAMMQAGYDTEDCSDDIFVISGSVNATGDKGERLTNLENVVVSKACEFPLSGLVKNTSDSDTRSIDFGDGSCDAMAEVTNADGETNTIDLTDNPKRGRGQKGSGNCDN